MGSVCSCDPPVCSEGAIKVAPLAVALAINKAKWLSGAVAALLNCQSRDGEGKQMLANDFKWQKMPRCPMEKITHPHFASSTPSEAISGDHPISSMMGIPGKPLWTRPLSWGLKLSHHNPSRGANTNPLRPTHGSTSSPTTVPQAIKAERLMLFAGWEPPYPETMPVLYPQGWNGGTSCQLFLAN